MHKLISIGFVLLYFTAMLRPIQPIVQYYLNQDYIAEFLCINKDKPEMHCNGKCFLKKKIKEQNEEEKENPPLVVHMENYPIGFVHIVEAPSKCFFHEIKRNYAYLNNYRYLFLPLVFHPPKS